MRALPWGSDAQVEANDPGFLSHSITGSDLLQLHGDVHHVDPEEHLKRLDVTHGRDNQMADLVRTQSEINIASSATPPEVYFARVAEQRNGGPTRCGGITDIDTMRRNLGAHCIPATMLDSVAPSLKGCLEERCALVAAKVKHWFKSLWRRCRSGGHPEHWPSSSVTASAFGRTGGRPGCSATWWSC